MKNTYKNLIISLFVALAFIGFSHGAYAATAFVDVDSNPIVNTTSATFSVTFNANSDSIDLLYVNYGTSTSMVNKTSTTVPAMKSGTMTFTAYNLTPNTTYYFQAVGETSIYYNGMPSAGFATSNIYTFTTDPIVNNNNNNSNQNYNYNNGNQNYNSNNYYNGNQNYNYNSSNYNSNQNTVNKNNNRPTVTTKAVTNGTPREAVLHGYANGNGSPVNVWFEYGKTPNLGNTTSVEYGGGATNANGSLGGLSINTTYYYRLVASNSYGTSYGNIMNFTTGKIINIYNNTIIKNTDNTTNTDTTNKDKTSQSSDTTDKDSNSSSSQDSNSSLSASAGSSGFSLIPHTFLGWLILILVIIVAVILIRMLQKNEYHDRGI